MLSDYYVRSSVENRLIWPLTKLLTEYSAPVHDKDNLDNKTYK